MNVCVCVRARACVCVCVCVCVRVCLCSGEVIQVRAQQEVILSAGAYRSPQLLMLSGVGPRDTLRDFDIPVVAARWGVGRNLQDHPQTSIAAGLHDSSDGYPKKPASYQSAAHGGFYMSSWCKTHGCTAPGIYACACDYGIFCCC